MKPLLIIKTGQTLACLKAQGEDFEDWIIAGLGLPASVVVVADVVAGAVLPDPLQLAGIVVTGSPAMVTEHAPWSERSARYLREAVHAELPVLGICYGHQLLAHAMGGEVAYHPRGREIGTVAVSVTAAVLEDPLFAKLPPHFPAHASHSQSVLRLPEQAVLLASSAHDEHHGFRIGAKAWGVQFHPEFDARIMQGYVQARQEDLRAEGFDIEDVLRQIKPTPEATRLLRDFARLAMS